MLKVNPLRLIIIVGILALVYAAAVMDWTLSQAFGESPSTTRIALSNATLFFLILAVPASITYFIFHSPHLALAVFIAGLLILFSGLEDALYFNVSGRPIPASLPWLSNNPLVSLFGQPPTSFSLWLSAIFWTGIALAVVLNA